MRRILSTIAFTLILAVSVTFGLTACDNGYNTVQSVCVNKITKKRTDDSRCPVSGDANLLYSWWYINPGQRIPGYGQRADQGTTHRPSGNVKRGGLPKSGGMLKKSNGGGSIFKNNTKSGSGFSKGGSSSRSGGFSSGGRGR